MEMKSKIFFAVILVLVFHLSVSLGEENAYQWAYQGDVALFEENGKIGLIHKDGRVLHTPEFDYVGCFDQNGLAEVVIDGKTGRMNRQGNVVIEPINCNYMGYITVHAGSTELRDEAIAYQNNENKWGFFSLQGSIISEAQWDDTYGFMNGIAYVEKNEQWNIIDISGKLLLDSWWNVINIGTQGQVSLSTSNKRISLDAYGNIHSTYEVDSEGKWHQIKCNKEKLSLYDSVLFGDGKWYAYQQEGLWGVLQSNGDAVTKPLWNSISLDAPETLLKVEEDSLYGWIDGFGEYVLTPQWLSLSKIVDNRWLGKHSNGEIWILDDTGEFICTINGNFRSIFSRKDGYIQYLTEEGNWGFYDCNGNLLSQIVENEVSEMLFAKYSDGWIQVELNGGDLGLMYVDGTILSSKDWESTKPFHYGYASVKINGKWGYIDISGQLVHPAIWDYADDYFYVDDLLIAPVKLSLNEDHLSYINEFGESICGIRDSN